ncbi:HTH lysR-type domain-containing protein, partial [Dysosmobacter welbionis]
QCADLQGPAVPQPAQRGPQRPRPVRVCAGRVPENR